MWYVLQSLCVMGLQWCLVISHNFINKQALVAALCQLSVFTQVFCIRNYKHYCLKNATIYTKMKNMFQRLRLLSAILTVGTSKALTTPPKTHIFSFLIVLDTSERIKNHFSFIFQCLKWLEPKRINTDRIQNINHMLHIDHFTARLIFSAFKMKLNYVACWKTVKKWMVTKNVGHCRWQQAWVSQRVALMAGVWMVLETAAPLLPPAVSTWSCSW